MQLLSCAFSNKKKFLKFQLIDIFRSKKTPSSQQISQVHQLDKFVQELASSIVDYRKIQNLSWNGIPACIRPKVWKYLLKYVLASDPQSILNKKRKEYQALVSNYWTPDTFLEEQKKIFHTIDVDVKRIGVEFSAFCKQPEIQLMLKRLLFIWHNRHPASGYVQGMCDISMPFLIVFLGEYLPYDFQRVSFTHKIDTLPSGTLQAVQADMYWCISKVIQSVTSNYTSGFDGLRQAYSKIDELLFRIDQQLYQHFKRQKIDLFALSFRNISTMLLRMFSANSGVRLFDTYIAYQGSYPQLMVFLLIAILQKFAVRLLGMRFEQLMAFLQNIPTTNWGDQDLSMIIAEAYCYQKIFADKK